MTSPTSRNLPLKDVLRALRVSHRAGEALGNPYVRLDADLVDRVIELLAPVSETQAQESEDAARYRWFRDECSHDRRVEITEISGTPDMLEHHIDKGRCGL
jgi:hypothetical protein